MNLTTYTVRNFKFSKLKKATIKGKTGQDGAYLAEFLLNNGEEVHEIKVRSFLIDTQRIDNIYHDAHAPNRNLYLHYWELTDFTNLM